MKKLLLFAILAAGAYFAWSRFAPSPAPSPARAAGDKTPAGNAQNRIDTLSGAAPAE